MIKLLKGTKDNPVYKLSFYTKEYDQAITNQGLESFNSVVDTIKSLVNHAIEKDHITGIEFHGANTSFLKENLEKITEIIDKAYKTNPKVFDNFHYQDETQKLDIENQKVSQQTRAKDFDEKGNIVWVDSATQEISLDNLMSSKEEFVKNFYFRKEFADKLLRHIGYTEGMEPFLAQKNMNKNTEKQRTNLYLRVLKNKFPDLPVVEDEFGRITVYLKNNDA